MNINAVSDGNMMPSKIGLTRVEAATYIGIGVTKFDEMVSAGQMPRPRKFGSRSIWSRFEIESAFQSMPYKETAQSSSWDDVA